jgi:regulator of sigma E protease
MFVAIISINLGLVNLLPVPALDGGHLMFFGLEGIMGRPLNARVQEQIMRGGIALLLSLIVVLTFFDILGNVTKQC